MRHLIVGTLLVMAALVVTAVTASLLERAAMNRQGLENPTAIVEGPSSPTANPPNVGKSARPGELARQVILVSRRLTASLKD